MVTQETDLMRAHVGAQLGTYFSRVDEIAPGLFFASSDRITDFYWNFAFHAELDHGGSGSCLEVIRQHANKVHRPATLFTRAGHATGGKESESWMTCPAQEETPITPKAALEVEIVTERQGMEDFLSVFRDAYGPAGVDSPGYSFLPESYPLSLSNAKPPQGVKVMHLVGRLDGKAVAIGSVFCRPPYAGLYNVGTRHSARRRGFASLISNQAKRQALNAGCSVIFLQTEPDSLLERMYRQMGFRRAFVGQFLFL